MVGTNINNIPDNIAPLSTRNPMERRAIYNPIIEKSNNDNGIFQPFFEDVWRLMDIKIVNNISGMAISANIFFWLKIILLVYEPAILC